MTNELAPAIPLDQIYPPLESNVFGPTKIRAFREDDEFRSFSYHFQQITPVVKLSEEHYQTTPSNGSLARAFEVYLTVVTRSQKHGYTVPDIHAKVGLLSPAEENAIIQWITLNFHKAKHMTQPPEVPAMPGNKVQEALPISVRNLVFNSGVGFHSLRGIRAKTISQYLVHGQ
jgi:hypothetical protein